jgi:L-amino acid N-acyltransferase
MELRAAREADLPAILAITNDAILHTTAIWSLVPTTLEARRGWLHERARQGYPVFVVTADADVLGFASYGDFRPWEGYRHTVEHSLYVDRRWRGRGVGKALLVRLIEHARTAGKHAMVAGIASENEVSLRLHLAFGFREVGCLREVGRKFERWLDLVLLERILASAGGEENARA